MSSAGGTATPTAAKVRWQRFLIAIFPVALLLASAVTVLVAVHGSVRWWAVLALVAGALASLVVRALPRRRAFLVPRELPGPPRVLMGREKEIDELIDLLSRPRDGTPVVVVTGAAGIGKTTLVIKVAHLVAAHFPDGQLFARFDPRVPPEERLRSTVRRFVSGLKRPGEAVPESTEEALRLYRSMVLNRRVLIVLDDVRTADDLGRLRPAGRGCALVATSRIRWDPGALPAGARVVRLGPLGEDDGLALLRHTITAERVRREERDARAIVRAAQGHPLALQATAVSLHSRPNTALWRALERIRARQESSRARAAAAGRGPAPAGPLDVVFPLLSEQERGALRLIGLLGDKELTGWRLAALRGDDWGTEAAEQAALRLIDRLVLAGLVERTREDTAGVPRFRVLDHVRDYAQTLVKEAPPGSGPFAWRAELGRLAEAEAARNRSAPAMSSGAVYYRIEQGQLQQAVGAARRALALAKDNGDDASAALAYAGLAELTVELGGVEEARDLAQAALHAPGARAAEPRAMRCIGKTHRRLRQLDVAVAVLERAHRAAELIGDASEQVRILCELAIARALGPSPRDGRRSVELAHRLTALTTGGGLRLEPSILHAEAWVLRREAESAGAVGSPLLDEADRILAHGAEHAETHGLRLPLAWINLQRAQVALAGVRPEDARGHARTAIIGFTEMRHRYGVAHCRLAFGRAYLGEDRLAEARLALEEALEGFRNCGDRWVDAEAARMLARVRARAGGRREAIQLLISAQRIFFSLGDERSWAEARDELDALSSPLRRPFLHAKFDPDPAAAFTVAAGPSENPL